MDGGGIPRKEPRGGKMMMEERMANYLLWRVGRQKRERVKGKNPSAGGVNLAMERVVFVSARQGGQNGRKSRGERLYVSK